MTEQDQEAAWQQSILRAIAAAQDLRSEYYVSPIIQDSVNRYIKDACPVGSFLQAVIENNLEAAAMKADIHNSVTLVAITAYVHNKIPPIARGSKAAYANWIKPKEDDGKS